MAVVDAVHLGGIAEEAARGCFITFEGPEGAGKTTQIARLKDRLEHEGFAVVVTREPGATTLGKSLRHLMLDTHEEPLAPAAMALMMSADRAQHVATVIRPALSMGAVVISDRYADSTYAYQGYGDGLDLGELRQITHLATGGLVPDLTILLDLEPALGVARKRHAHRMGRAEMNSMDERSLEFHRRVRAGFKALAQEDPNRFVVLDATGPADLLTMRIWKVVGVMIGIR
jgi:dTMP kinase